MTTFTLKIACDNAAFEPDNRDELARILRVLAVRLQDTGVEQGSVSDVNGNKVGQWSLT